MEKQRTPAFGKIEAIFHNSVTAWIVLSVSLVLTAAAWFVANNFVNERAHDRFIFQVDDLESAIKQRMIAYESLLRGGIGLFHSSNHVDRTEWAAYVENLDIEEYFPGIGGGYDMYSNAVRREAMEKARDTGQAVISGKVTLVQETNEDVSRVLDVFAFV